MLLDNYCKLDKKRLSIKYIFFFNRWYSFNSIINREFLLSCEGSMSSHSDFTLVEQTSPTLSVSLLPMEIVINLSSRRQFFGKEISLFPSYDYVLTTNGSELGAGASQERVTKNYNWQLKKEFGQIQMGLLALPEPSNIQRTITQQSE
ncbi:hypothetical protein ACTFIW_003374 [Dictyostelium discoideum]